MKQSKTWYTKIDLDENISVRYFYVFDDRKGLENKWVIKNHDKKEYSVITEQAAKMICESHGKDINFDGIEIIGKNNKAWKLEEDGSKTPTTIYRKMYIDYEDIDVEYHHDIFNPTDKDDAKMTVKYINEEVLEDILCGEDEGEDETCGDGRDDTVTEKNEKEDKSKNEEIKDLANSLIKTLDMLKVL